MNTLSVSLPSTLHSLPRMAAASVFAVLITFTAFWLMQGLISAGKSVIEQQDQGRLIDFVDVSQDDSLQTKQRKPKKPPIPPEEPPKPEIPKPKLDSAVTNTLEIGALSVNTDISIDAGLSGGTGDGEYLPIVKVAPQYPRRAAQRGIEGYVVVEFDVSPLGSVVNVQVIEAAPPNVFNRAAISAAEKFKYKPKMLDGKGVEVKGIRNIIRFELDKSQSK